MKAKELIDKYNLHATGGHSQTMFLPAVENLMEEYGKYHAELAFDAGMEYQKRVELWQYGGILSENKQEYINKTFPNEQKESETNS